MDSQLHRRDYDRPLYPDHKDEAQTVNDTPVVRSGLAEPTVMGTPVLAEDLYATHSDLPVRSSGQRERDGAPPPGYGYETHVTDVPHGGHYTYGGEVNREQYKGSVGKHTFLEKVVVARSPPGYESLTDPVRAGDYGYGQDVNREALEGCFGNPSGLEDERYGGLPPPSTGVYGTRLTDLAQVGDHETRKSVGMEEDPSAPKPTTTTGGKEVGITEVLHSFDKMKVFDKHDNESESLDYDKHEQKVYAGSHDQFKPEPVENPPLDTIAANPSHPNSSYSQKISSATSAIADKAAAVKNTIVSKLNSSSEQKSDAGTAHKTDTKTLLPTATALSHKVADTLLSTLGPVYEKVAEVGSSVTSKMHRSGDGATVGNRETKTEGKGVKEYLADTFKPQDDDKALSDVITQAFHRGKGNQQPSEGSTTTTYEVEVPREGSTATYEVEVARDEGERRLQGSGN